MTTTTTAPAPVILPTRVSTDDAALLARAARVLHGRHVVCNLDEPDPDDPCDGVVELWSIGDHAHVAELQRLLARAARALQDEHVELVLDVPDAGDPPDGVVVLWTIGGDHTGAVGLQRLLAGAGIPSVVSSTEVLDPDTAETPADPRALAAHHEAGHAIAGCLRGSVLRSIALGEVDGDGLTVHRGPSWDDPYVSYAGPWAEARFLWGDRPADEENEDYLVFADHLFGVFLGAGAEDWQELQAHYARLAELAGLLPPEITAGDLERITTQKWAVELEAVWPAIELIATHLLAGEEITDENVGEAIRVCLVAALSELP